MTNRNIKEISSCVLGVTSFPNLPFRVNRRATSFIKKSADIVKEEQELRELFDKEEDNEKKKEIEQELIDFLNKESDLVFDLPSISDFDNVENTETVLKFANGERVLSHTLINMLVELGFITE